jgi:hypothetical protein
MAKKKDSDVEELVEPSGMTIDQKLDRIIEMLQARVEPKATVAEVSAILNWFKSRGADASMLRSPELSNAWSDEAEEFVAIGLSQALQVKYGHIEKVQVYLDKEVQRQRLHSARVDWMFDVLKIGLNEASINHVCTASQLKKWLDQLGAMT